MKKYTSLLLLVAMLASLAACGGADTPTDTTAASAETPSPTTESPFEADDLPADLDLGGKAVKIHVLDYASAYAVDIIAEEETGSRLNDAIYNTSKAVEDRLNVKLSYTSEAFVYAQLAEVTTKVISSILAGDAEMDLMYSMDNFMARMLEGDYFHNLRDMKYLSLDKPWYNQTVQENIIGDYVHFVSGMFAIANVKNSFAMYFNADLFESLGKNEDLYGLVDSGKWTFSKMQELIKDSYADLNGDTKKDPFDQYGLTFGDQNKYLGFLGALGITIFEKEGNNFNFTYDNEKAVTAISALVKLVNEHEAVLPGKHNNDNSPDFQMTAGGGNYVSKPFMEGRSLFTCSLVADAATIVPGIDFDFGILPYPKWDEAQDNYLNMLQRQCYLMIPATVTDTDTVSAVMEAIASQSYRSLLPEYCEVTLKTRYSPDDNVSRMFDLIGSGVTFDPGEIYGNFLGTPSAELKNVITQNNPNWASLVASKKDSYIEKMNSLVK